MRRLGTKKVNNFSKVTWLRRGAAEVGPMSLGSSVHALRHPFLLPTENSSREGLWGTWCTISHGWNVAYGSVKAGRAKVAVG